jgi:hypothetical protein
MEKYPVRRSDNLGGGNGEDYTDRAETPDMRPDFPFDVYGLSKLFGNGGTVNLSDKGVQVKLEVKHHPEI